MVLRASDEDTRIRRTRDGAADILRAGDATGAAAILDALVAEVPADATAWTLLAAARAGTGDLGGARTAAERAWSLSRTARGLAHILAHCRLGTGDADGALEAAALATEPEARAVAARALRALGRRTEAAAAFADAVAARGDAGLLIEATQIEMELGALAFPGAARHRDRAAAYGRRLAEIASGAPAGDPVGALAAAVAADATPLREPDTVAELYQRAAEIGHGATATAARIAFLVREGRVGDARDVVRKAAATAVGAAVPLASALARAGDTEGAANELRAAAEQSPADRGVRAALVPVLAAAGSPADALAAAADGSDGDPAVVRAAAVAALAAGDEAHAHAALDALLEKHPGDAQALLLRHAAALQRLVEAVLAGRAPATDELAARDALDRIRAVAPDHPVALAWAARLAAADGRACDAWQFARRRAELTPEDPEARADAWRFAAAGADDSGLSEVTDALLGCGDAPADDLAALAEAARTHGRRPVAARVLSEAAHRFPDDPRFRHDPAPGAQHGDADPLAHPLELLCAGRPDEAEALLALLTAAPDAPLAALVLHADAIAASALPRDAASAKRDALRSRLAARSDGVLDLQRLDAQIALARGDGAEALPRLVRYLGLRPADPVAWWDAARAHELLGDTPAAIAALRRVAHLAPDHQDARIALAHRLHADAARRMAAGDRAGAHAALDECISVLPGWSPGRLALACVLASEGRADLAEAHGRSVENDEPENLVAGLVLAVAEETSGRRDAALARLDALVTAHPDVAGLRVKRGLALLRAGRSGEAGMDFQSAVEAGAAGADLAYGLAGCAALEGRAGDALAHAQRAVALAPRAAFAHAALGEARRLAGDAAGAVSSFRTAFDCEPRDPSPLASAARVLAAAGRWDEVTEVSGGIPEPPADVLALRAEAARRAGRLEEAQRWFEEAAAEVPAAWTSAAAVASSRGDRLAVVRLLRAAIDRGTADRSARSHLAAVLVDLGRTDEAVPILERLHREGPDDFVALNNLALALAEALPDLPADADDRDRTVRQRHLSRALTLAARARELAPSSPAVADTLGRVRWKAGDGSGARAAFEEAIRLGPCASARYHLALVDLHEGRRDAARAHLSAALAAAPDAPWANRARELAE